MMSGAAWLRLRRKPGAGSPIPLEMENQIPISKGLGSSSSALPAAAVNFLCGLNWEREKLLKVASAREGHPDNLAPSIWGGLVASIYGERIFFRKSGFPREWMVIAVTPALEISTDFARSILSAEISREHAIYDISGRHF